MEVEMFRVVVGVDGRSTGRDAIALARALRAADARAALVHVYRLTPAGMASYALGGDKLQRDEAHQLLVDERDATGFDAALTCQRDSSVGGGLHHSAEHAHADLLVVGSCHRGVAGRIFAGNDTRAVLHGAPCAVAIAPLGYAEASRAITTIGVGYNEMPEGEAALGLARELGAQHGATVRALEVVELPSAPYGFGGGLLLTDVLGDMLAAAQRRMDALDGVDGEAVVGFAGEELATFSAQVDLLIAGSRGYGPLRSLILGSTSAHLVSHARSPLLVIPRTSAASGTPAARESSGRADDPVTAG
jgi:nucleotide-binding universal stress UspA family protein